MTILSRHQTKTEFALHVLREKINRGELQPGQRVRVAEFQGELGMSPTPIREAPAPSAASSARSASLSHTSTGFEHPAALKGVTGLRPTLGRVGIRCVFPITWTLP